MNPFKSCLPFVAFLVAEAVQPSGIHVDVARNKLQAKQGCLDLQNFPIGSFNLTEQELEVLPDICWREDIAQLTFENFRSHGVPRGVKCNITTWCDKENRCSTVCSRGSVVVEPWLKHALTTQFELTRRLPLCLATLFGTHNSAITMADGYGGLDDYIQQYFSFISWVASDAVLRTNDQWLSLTDQLNLGVRSVELDTHWVEGALRIAHCGGFHSVLNTLVQAINLVAKLMRHPIHWDTETIGCNPSLSSIAVLDQRTFKDALQEIAVWLARPENADEFLVLYLDDQPDLLEWGKVDVLLADILSVFPMDKIYTPVEHEARPEGAWLSINDLVKLGKHLLFVSASDYGFAMKPLIFSREGPLVCKWKEPPLDLFRPEPDCTVSTEAHPAPERTLQGRLLRITSCELMYGPLNCDFAWRPYNGIVLDETNLPRVSRCGINMPSPDLLTPQRAASHIWSWAEGHPFQPPQRHSPFLLPWPLTRLWRAIFPSTTQAGCAAISEADGRWRAMDCTIVLPTACRFLDGSWLLWPGEKGRCPNGSNFEVPHTAKENVALQSTLHLSPLGVAAAWLPMFGPDWRIQWPTESHLDRLSVDH